MKLTAGQDVTLVGTVETRRVIRPRSGNQPFVKAIVSTDADEKIIVVWWDAGRAPDIGTRLQLTGRVKQYEGAPEVHANEWAVEQSGPPDDPIARIMGFYIGCVEADAAGSVSVRPGSSDHIELITGSSPVHGRRELPSEKSVVRWCEQREMAIGESIITGWPMIIGADVDDGSHKLVASPLLTSDAPLQRASPDQRSDRLHRRHPLSSG